jgi:hypothetical protein
MSKLSFNTVKNIPNVEEHFLLAASKFMCNEFEDFDFLGETKDDNFFHRKLLMESDYTIPKNSD